MKRYCEIPWKNSREIVLLRGRGCAWRKCSFCDYHLDFSPDEAANYALNSDILGQVTGKYGKLEVVNSGSFIDLDDETIDLIRKVSVNLKIQTVHFESHWLHRRDIAALHDFFQKREIRVKMKIGLETFDTDFRENVLRKGISAQTPEEIAAYFDEICLLVGLSGQSLQGMLRDIQTGLTHFERICVNLLQANTTQCQPDKETVRLFKQEIYPLYKDHPRVDILLKNTDYGVGG